MRRALLFALSLILFPAFAKVQFLATLPNNAIAETVQLDSAGNIYVAGWIDVYRGNNPGDAFVAKLSPDGSQIIFFTTIPGFHAEEAVAIAVASDGAVYCAGNTTAPSFPTTKGAFQTTPGAGNGMRGFLVKLNPFGGVSYSTYISGAAPTRITGLTLDVSDNPYVTGFGGPDAPASQQQQQGFILKLDATLSKPLLSIYGYGGGVLTIDAQSNIYIAGAGLPNGVSGTPPATLPILPPGAFQPTHVTRLCRTPVDGTGDNAVVVPCLYQYVAKLNASGVPLWATYVTGSYGAFPRAMAVDSAGNVIVAGTTNSDDYPVTPGAFQTAYSASVDVSNTLIYGVTYSDPPAEIGYVTKVNATGSGLIWSTYFGGTRSDKIFGMRLAPSGEVFISGLASSPDLPSIASLPEGCRPSGNQNLGFVVRLNAAGTAASAPQLITGAPDCLFACPASAPSHLSPASWPLALRPDGTVVIAGKGGAVASVDFTSSSRLSCMIDPADNAQLRAVAPGQLITIFGPDLAPAKPFIPAAGVASSTAAFGVFFNGVPAPILYSAGQQINVQVPFEIAGQSSVRLRVANQQIPLAFSEGADLKVVDQQPSLFLTAAALKGEIGTCGNLRVLGLAPIAINEDGTLNDCAHPAPSGSRVSLLLNGLGQASPPLRTGAIAEAPPLTLGQSADIQDLDFTSLGSATLTVPGLPSGVSQVQFRIPQIALGNRSNNPIGQIQVIPVVAGRPVREGFTQVWVRFN